MTAAEAWDVSDLQRAINRAVDAVVNMDFGPILPDIGEIGQLDSIRRIQSTKVDPDGKPWPAWSTAYARSGRGRSLERYSGDLMGSIDHFVSGRNETTLEADLPYAARQHFGFSGTDSLGRHVEHPARAYLGLSSEAYREIGDVIAGHVVHVFGEAFA